MIKFTRANPIKIRNASTHIEKVTRVYENIDPFVFRGKINDKVCKFKISYSDVTVVNPSGC